MNNIDSFVRPVPNSSITDKAVSPVPIPKTGDVPLVNIDTETKCVTHNECETDKKLSAKPARTRQSRSDSADVGRRTLAKQRANRSLSKTRLKQTNTAEEPKDKPKKRKENRDSKGKQIKVWIPHSIQTRTREMTKPVHQP